MRHLPAPTTGLRTASTSRRPLSQDGAAPAVGNPPERWRVARRGRVDTPRASAREGRQRQADFQLQSNKSDGGRGAPSGWCFYAGESTVTSYPETFRRSDERRVDAAAAPSDSP